MINWRIEKEIIKNIDLTMLLDELGVDYRNSGEYIRTVCVFHENASKFNLALNKDKKSMICFSHHCEQHEYNLTDFVMRAGNIKERNEAVEFMAKLVGVEIDNKGWNIKPIDYNKKKGLMFKESAIAYRKNISNILPRESKLYLKESDIREYHSDLKEKKSAICYLKSRGLNEDDMEDYYLGFDCEEERIVFPIYNENGKLKAVSKRIIYNTDENESKPKYKCLGNKSECLYGYYHLMQKGLDTNNVILVEGTFDAIMLQKYGYSAIALMGCVISNYQLKILKEMNPDHIILCLDNDSIINEDNAGKEGTLKCINNFSRVGFDLEQISVIQLKGNYQDPDEVPATEFRQFYERRIKGIDYYLMNQVR